MSFEKMGIRKYVTFNNFMVGESNKEAYQAAFDRGL
jgi:chromosomal replication initiation ATPase DnaA